MSSAFTSLISKIENYYGDKDYTTQDAEHLSRLAIVEYAREKNALVASARQVSPDSIEKIIDIAIKQNLAAQPSEWMVFAANAVDNVLGYSHEGILASGVGAYTDFLPEGHPSRTNRPAMTASVSARATALWVAGDPRIASEQARLDVFNAYSTKPGSVEAEYAGAKLSALVSSGYIPEDVTLPITAAFKMNFAMRSAIAKALAAVRRRHGDGRFAEEFGRLKGFFGRKDGSIFSSNGRIVGAVPNTNNFEVAFPGDADIPKGVYTLDASRTSSLKAVLSKRALKNVKGLKPTDSIAMPTESEKRMAVSLDEFLATRKDAPSGWTKNEDGSFTSKSGHTSRVVDAAPEGDYMTEGIGESGKIDPAQPIFELTDKDGKTLGVAQDWAGLNKISMSYDALDGKLDTTTDDEPGFDQSAGDSSGLPSTTSKPVTSLKPGDKILSNGKVLELSGSERDPNQLKTYDDDGQGVVWAKDGEGKTYMLDAGDNFMGDLKVVDDQNSELYKKPEIPADLPTKRAGEVKVGDTVINPITGKPAKVAKVFNYERPSYKGEGYESPMTRVIYEDGTSSDHEEFRGALAYPEGDGFDQKAGDNSRPELAKAEDYVKEFKDAVGEKPRSWRSKDGRVRISRVINDQDVQDDVIKNTDEWSIKVDGKEVGSLGTGSYSDKSIDELNNPTNGSYLGLKNIIEGGLTGDPEKARADALADFRAAEEAKSKTPEAIAAKENNDRVRAAIEQHRKDAAEARKAVDTDGFLDKADDIALQVANKGDITGSANEVDLGNGFMADFTEWEWVSDSDAPGGYYETRTVNVYPSDEDSIALGDLITFDERRDYEGEWLSDGSEITEAIYDLLDRKAGNVGKGYDPKNRIYSKVAGQDVDAGEFQPAYGKSRTPGFNQSAGNGPAWADAPIDFDHLTEPQNWSQFKDGEATYTSPDGKLKLTFSPDGDSDGEGGFVDASGISVEYDGQPVGSFRASQRDLEEGDIGEGLERLLAKPVKPEGDGFDQSAGDAEEQYAREQAAVSQQLARESIDTENILSKIGDLAEEIFYNDKGYSKADLGGLDFDVDFVNGDSEAKFTVYDADGNEIGSATFNPNNDDIGFEVGDKLDSMFNAYLDKKLDELEPPAGLDQKAGDAKEAKPLSEKQMEPATAKQYALLEELNSERDGIDPTTQQAINDALEKQNLTKAQMASLFGELTKKPFKPGIDPTKPTDRQIDSLQGYLTTKELSPQEMSDILDQLDAGLDRAGMEALTSKLRRRPDRTEGGFDQAAGTPDDLDQETIDKFNDFANGFPKGPKGVTGGPRKSALSDLRSYLDESEALRYIEEVDAGRSTSIQDSLDSKTPALDAYGDDGQDPRWNSEYNKTWSDAISNVFNDPEVKKALANRPIGNERTDSDPDEALVDEWKADVATAIANAVEKETQSDEEDGFDQRAGDVPEVWSKPRQIMDSRTQRKVDVSPKKADKDIRDRIDEAIEKAVTDAAAKKRELEALGSGQGDTDWDDANRIQNQMGWAARSKNFDYLPKEDYIQDSYSEIEDAWDEQKSRDDARAAQVGTIARDWQAGNLDQDTKDDIIDRMGDYLDNLRVKDPREFYLDFFEVAKNSDSGSRMMEKPHNYVEEFIDYHAGFDPDYIAQMFQEAGVGLSDDEGDGFDQATTKAPSAKMSEPATEAQYNYLKNLAETKMDVDPETAKAIQEALDSKNLTKSQAGGFIGKLRDLGDKENVGQYGKPSQKMIDSVNRDVYMKGLSDEDRAAFLDNLENLSKGDVSSLISQLKLLPDVPGGMEKYIDSLVAKGDVDALKRLREDGRFGDFNQDLDKAISKLDSGDAGFDQSAGKPSYDFTPEVDSLRDLVDRIAAEDDAEDGDLGTYNFVKKDSLEGIDGEWEAYNLLNDLERLHRDMRPKTEKGKQLEADLGKAVDDLKTSLNAKVGPTEAAKHDPEDSYETLEFDSAVDDLEDFFDYYYPTSASEDMRSGDGGMVGDVRGGGWEAALLFNEETGKWDAQIESPGKIDESYAEEFDDQDEAADWIDDQLSTQNNMAADRDTKILAEEGLDGLIKEYGDDPEKLANIMEGISSWLSGTNRGAADGPSRKVGEYAERLRKILADNPKA